MAGSVLALITSNLRKLLRSPKIIHASYEAEEGCLVWFWFFLLLLFGAVVADFTETVHELMHHEMRRTNNVGPLLCFVACWHFKQHGASS